MHQTIISKIGRAPLPPNYKKLMEEPEKEKKKPKISLRQLFFLKKKGIKKKI